MSNAYEIFNHLQHKFALVIAVLKACQILDHRIHVILVKELMRRFLDARKNDY